MGVPGMAVYNVRSVQGPGHLDIAQEDPCELLQTCFPKSEIKGRVYSGHLQARRIQTLGTKTKDLDGVRPIISGCKFTREVFNVNAGSPVDVRRIFVGQYGDFHFR